MTETLDFELDQLAINTIRALAIDAVQAANSGHPGAPMGHAPVAYTLWQRFLRYDPEQPIWPSRDRFVLSVGHASMLLNALPHLTGVKAVNPNAAGLPASRPASTLRSPSAGWRRPATVRASTSSIVTSTRSTATAA